MKCLITRKREAEAFLDGRKTMQFDSDNYLKSYFTADGTCTSNVKSRIAQPRH